MTMVKPLAGRANHFVTGLAVDGGRSSYESDTEIARLTAARGTAGPGQLDAEAASPPRRGWSSSPASPFC
jgi:hypothetical protein